MELSKEATAHLAGLIILGLGLHALVTGRITSVSGSDEDSDYQRETTITTGPTARLSAAVIVAGAVANLLDHTGLGIGFIVASCIILFLL